MHLELIILLLLIASFEQQIIVAIRMTYETSAQYEYEGE